MKTGDLMFSSAVDNVLPLARKSGRRSGFSCFGVRRGIGRYPIGIVLVAMMSAINAQTPLMITTTNLPNATAGMTYSYPGLSAQGGTPPYHFFVTNSTVPGFTFLQVQSGNTLTGCPTQVETTSVSLLVQDTPGLHQAAATLNISVVASTVPLTFTPASVSSTTAGNFYQVLFQLIAPVGSCSVVNPYTWSVSRGSLPPGISLSSSSTATASIGGIPTTPGTYNFTMKLTDGSGNSGSQDYTLVVNESACAALIADAVHLSIENNGAHPLTTMVATFSPNGGKSLSEAAGICGVVAFNWQQTVTAFPTPTDLSYCNLTAKLGFPAVNGVPQLICPYANSANPNPLFPTSPLIAPFPDPPAGGLTFENIVDNSYPFYCGSQDFMAEPSGTGLCFSQDPLYTLFFSDTPADPALDPQVADLAPPATSPTGTQSSFITSLNGVLPGNTAGPPLYYWSWISTFNGYVGNVARTKNPSPGDPGSGAGGVTITSVNGLQLSPLSSAQISATASGLAYSRVSQTFNGTVAIKNISGIALSGPFQVVLMSLTPGVTLVNASGNFVGNAYITSSLTSLAAGQSITVNVQFRNPADAPINFTPVIYSGSLN